MRKYVLRDKGRHNNNNRRQSAISASCEVALMPESFQVCTTLLIALWCIALYCIVLHFAELHFRNFIAPYLITLQYCTALRCVSLHCTALQYGEYGCRHSEKPNFHCTLHCTLHIVHCTERVHTTLCIAE